MIKWITRLRERYNASFPTAEKLNKLAASLITKTSTEELLIDLEANKVDVRLFRHDYSKGWKCHVDFEPGLLPGTRVDFDTNSCPSPRQAVEAGHKYWFDHEHPPKTMASHIAESGLPVFVRKE